VPCNYVWAMVHYSKTQNMAENDTLSCIKTHVISILDDCIPSHLTAAGLWEVRAIVLTAVMIRGDQGIDGNRVMISGIMTVSLFQNKHNHLKKVLS